MSWRDRLAKMLVGSPNAGLTTDAYHGTRRVFNEFMPWSYDEAGSMDRALGTHAAKDPAMSSEAFVGMPKDYNRLGAAEYDNLNEKPHVIPLKIPPEAAFLQAQQPLVYPGGELTPLWKRARTDTVAIENMISEEAFRRHPEMLQEYLRYGRTLPEPDARAAARELAAGGSVPIEREGKAYDLPGLINNYIARPHDKQFAVDTARDAWQGQGYAGIKYINTAPMEAGAPGVKDPTSYIIFNPADIRSRFAKFNPADIASPDLMRGVVAAPIGALGATYDPNQYEASQ